MEIVAPAGNFEKLQYAIAYNADAVYLAGEQFGLRAFAGNFSISELQKAVKSVHNQNKKVFLTLNVFSDNKDVEALPEYLQEIKNLNFDALIVSEPGTLNIVKKHTDFPIHLSTQANTTNYEAVRFWKDFGISRIILAREVSFSNTIEIMDKIPDIELEVFIHGAMCMAWSGRCLMSALLNDRSANKGECTHPCRWEWNLTEPTREGQIFSIEEDNRGSYIMYSKDLCLLKEIPLISTYGIQAGKIEGRMKSTYYTALMSRIYRTAKTLDPQSLKDWENLAIEANKINHRPYFTGFFYDKDDKSLSDKVPEIDLNSYPQQWNYCGKTCSNDAGILWFDCLSKIEVGDSIEIIFPDMNDDISMIVDKLYDANQILVDKTKPNAKYGIPTQNENYKWGLVRSMARMKDNEK